MTKMLKWSDGNLIAANIKMLQQVIRTPLQQMKKTESLNMEIKILSK